MRDQLTLAMKWEDGADNVGSVAYEYCLTCDSAMSRRFVYAGGSGSTQGEILQGQRFVYDGLTLLRVDQLYDSDEDEALEMTDGWRVWWENTPGFAKRVYSYADSQSGTSNGHSDYYYAFDGIGNVVAICDSNGVRQFVFTQDSFGNELMLNSLGGNDWDTARDAGMWEHQTGKWIDPVTGLYYFHSRFYDPVTGRWIQRDQANDSVNRYQYCANAPTNYFDLNGQYIEIGWEITVLGWDIYHGNYGDACIDIIFMVIPFVPAGVHKCDDAYDAYKGSKRACTKKPVERLGPQKNKLPKDVCRALGLPPDSDACRKLRHELHKDYEPDMTWCEAVLIAHSLGIIDDTNPIYQMCLQDPGRTR